MTKTVYLSERGDDKNDGLTPETAVLSGKRAVQVALKEGARAFNVTGSHTYVRRMNTDIEMQGRTNITHRIR